MCGIYACIARGVAHRASNDLESLLSRRGPDHLGEWDTATLIDDQPVSLSFASTVLALRGEITAQPFHDDASGSVFCWNGEAWRLDEELVEGNDGEAVFQRLLAASATQPTAPVSVDAVVEAIRSISGPFALVFFDKPHGKVYFCRDRLGRRSLLFNADGVEDAFQIASVAGTLNHWTEVEADGIYVLDCRSKIPTRSADAEGNSIWSKNFLISHIPWLQDAAGFSVFSLGALSRVNTSDTFHLHTSSSSVVELEAQLKDSLQLRVVNVPTHLKVNPANVTVAILFSGGLDCTVLARMAHNLLPRDQSIDLLNVAFENPRVVQAAKRQQTTKKRGGGVAKEGPGIADEFEALNTSPYEACPDRITGRKAFEELQQVCPERSWRFVEINIPYAETTAHRNQVVSLIYPHQTEMDLSIAYALYFASRGIGQARVNSGPATPYASPARVLLSGLGADELFGGYVRHETAFARRGMDGLLDELELDVNRLGKRNLGRDDRVISHWGREARFPYLDERLVKWALAKPAREKCGFGEQPRNEGGDDAEPDIEPGKLALRLLAWKLGMKSVSREKKRAIQFGARTAKMETGQTKGTTLIS